MRGAIISGTITSIAAPAATSELSPSQLRSSSSMSCAMEIPLPNAETAPAVEIRRPVVGGVLVGAVVVAVKDENVHDDIGNCRCPILMHSLSEWPPTQVLCIKALELPTGIVMSDEYSSYWGLSIEAARFGIARFGWFLHQLRDECDENGMLIAGAKLLVNIDENVCRPHLFVWMISQHLVFLIIGVGIFFFFVIKIKPSTTKRVTRLFRVVVSLCWKECRKIEFVLTRPRSRFKDSFDRLSTHLWFCLLQLAQWGNCGNVLFNSLTLYLFLYYFKICNTRTNKRQASKNIETH